MKEHEQLKWICDEIGYDIDLNLYKIGRTYIRDKTKKQCTQCLKSTSTDRIINVREIIFTPEFMDKLRPYALEYISGKDFAWELIKNNLDNPVQYLAELLGLKD